VFRGLAVASVLQGLRLELLVALVCGAALLGCHGGALCSEPLLEALVGAVVGVVLMPAALGDASVKAALVVLVADWSSASHGWCCVVLVGWGCLVADGWELGRGRGAEARRGRAAGAARPIVGEGCPAIVFPRRAGAEWHRPGGRG